MVKLVVADDEERVCRLIVALGNWEELGIKVVGTAANGIQALELIRKEKTDILITDIRMPGLNGLELIEKVREISPDIKIMIISGYANFEYAQNALKQGVSDYLLKPINKDALNESLTKIGMSITIMQGMYHDFEVEPGTGPVLIGEVSQCNDDNIDNRFNPPAGRFPEIEEDEPPYRLLCNEYPEAPEK